MKLVCIPNTNIECKFLNTGFTQACITCKHVLFCQIQNFDVTGMVIEVIPCKLMMYVATLACTIIFLDCELYVQEMLELIHQRPAVTSN